MIHAAHASRFHWGEIGTPLEFERGEWQISRVYSTLKRSEPALYHAKRCLEICKENSIGDFDIAFAYEAMARGHAIAGNKTECEKYLQLAEGAGKQIGKKEDRDYFLGELKTINKLDHTTIFMKNVSFGSCNLVPFLSLYKGSEGFKVI